MQRGFSDGDLQRVVLRVLGAEDLGVVQGARQIVDGISAGAHYRHAPGRTRARHKAAIKRGQQPCPRQRRFAAARCPDHGQKARRAEFSDKLLALATAPEEEVTLVDLERPQARDRVGPGADLGKKINVRLIHCSTPFASRIFWRNAARLSGWKSPKFLMTIASRVIKSSLGWLLGGAT